MHTVTIVMINYSYKYKYIYLKNCNILLYEKVQIEAILYSS